MRMTMGCRDSGAADSQTMHTMGCCVLSGEHTFSEEQEEMPVDTSSAALEFSEA